MEPMQIQNQYTDWNHLDYVEFHVVDRCNLNCSACSHFSPMVKHDFDHFDSFKRDITRLKELFAYIINIRLLGGEPFLEKRLDEYVNCARCLYPYAKIEVVTNGLLIPTVRDDVLKALSRQNILVNITLYPPTAKIRQKIENILKQYHITYSFTELVTNFRKKFLPEGTSNAAHAFSECTVGRHCTFVYLGRLYLCSGAALVKYYSEYNGTQIICKDSSLDLNQTNAREILSFLQRPNDSCRYCGRTSIEPWSICQNLTHINPAHWITDAGVIT